jgi:hypothetical protein
MAVLKVSVRGPYCFVVAQPLMVRALGRGGLLT